MKRANKVQALEKRKQDHTLDRKTLERISEAVEMEKDPYIKCIIAILANTGMRIGELPKLTTYCIDKDSIGRDIISWHDSKILSSTYHMPSNIPDISTHTVPVPRGCVVAFEELIKATKGLREQADKSINDCLFIIRANSLRSNEIKQMTALQLQKLLKSFAKRNNILDIKGEPLNLTSHYLRHVFFNRQTDDYYRRLEYHSMLKNLALQFQVIDKDTDLNNN